MDPQACAEVLDILKYVPKEDYDKIPSDFIDLLYQNADTNTTFSYNAGVPFADQQISEEAKKILSEISKRFWDK